MANKPSTTEVPDQLVTIALGDGGTDIQIDRLALDKAVQRQLKTEDRGAAIMLQLFEDSFWTNIHEDSRVLDANGKPFKTWGLWYADRVSSFELAKEVFSKPLISRLLAKASVREVVAASGWSRGYVHEINLERQGKPTTKEKNAAKKEAAKKAAAEAPSTPAEGASSEAGASSDLSVLVDAAVSAIDKVIAQIANLTVEDLARFSAKIAEGHTAADAMTGINEVNAAVNAQAEANEAKVAPKPRDPRRNGKTEAVVA